MRECAGIVLSVPGDVNKKASPEAGFFERNGFAYLVASTQATSFLMSASETAGFGGIGTVP